MCGLVGYIGQEPFDLLKAKLLFSMNQHRGEDSCGMYVPGSLIKVDGKANENLLPHYKIPPSNLFIGHLRQGTSGTKVKENSHPFRCGKLIGAHNGKVTNHVSLTRLGDFFHENHITVDSHIMFRYLQYLKERGEENYLAEGLQNIDGAIAMLLYDSDTPNELQFFRNYERPLFYGKISNENGNHYYFSSTNDALRAIGIPTIDIVNTKTDTIYRIKMEENALIVNQTEWKKKYNTHSAYTLPARKSPVMKIIHNRETADSSTYFDIFRRSTLDAIRDMRGEKVTAPSTESSHKSGDLVCYTNSSGNEVKGKVIAAATPYAEIYMIVSLDGFEIIHGNNMCTVEDDIPEVSEKFDLVSDLNEADLLPYFKDKMDKRYTFLDNNGIRRYGKINYIPASGRHGIKVQILTDEGDFLNVYPSKLQMIEDLKTLREEYVDCHNCMGGHTTNQTTCTECNGTGELKIQTPAAEVIELNEYDSASHLYSENRDKGEIFLDNDEMETINNCDTILEAISITIREWMDKDHHPTADEYRQLLVNITEERGNLLEAAQDLLEDINEMVDESNNDRR